MFPKKSLTPIDAKTFFSLLSMGKNNFVFRCIHKKKQQRGLDDAVKIVNGLQWSVLSKLASDEYDIYFNVNVPAQGKLRKIIECRTLYLDIDKCDPFVSIDDINEALGVTPSLVVNTNPVLGKWHIYYLLEDELDRLDVNLVAEKQKLLVEKVNSLGFGVVADPGVKDITRILRAPGFKRLTQEQDILDVQAYVYDVDVGVRTGLRDREIKSRVVRWDLGAFNFCNDLGGVVGDSAVDLDCNSTVDSGVYDYEEEIRNYLKGVDGAIEGEGGDNHTFNILMGVKAKWGSMVSEGDVLGLLDEWNSRCEPPWSSGELRRKIANVWKYSKVQDGIGEKGLRDDDGTLGEIVAQDVKWATEKYGVGNGIGNGSISGGSVGICRDASDFERAGEEYIPPTFLKERLVDCSGVSLVGMVEGLGFNLVYNTMDNVGEFIGYVPWGDLGGRGATVNENTVFQTKCYIQGWCRSKSWEFSGISDKDLGMALMGRALDNSYNPLVGELEAMVWDGVSRIDRLGDLYFGIEGSVEEREIQNRFLRHWVLGAVARIVSPGCKFDNMLVLVGKQGCGKSTSFRMLFGEKYYTDSLRGFSSKDDMQVVAGKWIIEVAELSAMSKGTNEEIKKFLSSVSDTFRLPYATTEQTFPRKAVLYGTTNNGIFLNDPTGNRRYWPVKVGEIDLLGLGRDRELLLAECMDRIGREGIDCRLLPKIYWKTAAAFTSQFEDKTIDVAIQDFVSDSGNLLYVIVEGEEWEYFTNSELVGYVNFETRKNFVARTISEHVEKLSAMGALEGADGNNIGWEYRRIRDEEGKQPRVWARPRKRLK